MSIERLNALVNQHVNHWFHHEREDCGSPAITLKQCNELFLATIRRMRLDIFCEDSQFRRLMCEALCTIYVTHKERTKWRGPHSEPPRPRDWSSGKERVWREYRDYHYLNSDFWHNFWLEIPEALWESSLPNWRLSYQSVAPHYLDVLNEKVDESTALDFAKMDNDVDGAAESTISKPNNDYD